MPNAQHSVILGLRLTLCMDTMKSATAILSDLYRKSTMQSARYQRTLIIALQLPAYSVSNQQCLHFWYILLVHTLQLIKQKPGQWLIAH